MPQSTPVKIVLWSLAVVIAVIIILGIVYAVNQPQSGDTGTPQSYEDEYQPFGFWGALHADPDTTRNKCRLYNFPGSLSEATPPVCYSLHGNPGQPTLSAEILDSLESQSLPGCYDIDQIVAAKVEHTCITTTNLESGDYTGINAEGQPGISFCYRLDGTKAAIGDSESLYTTNATLIDPSTGDIGSVACSTQTCAGTLSLYGLNYKVVTYNTSTKKLEPIFPVCVGSNTYKMYLRCLRLEGDTIAARVCDIGDQDQMYRVIRVDPGVSVPSTGSSGKNGFLAQIYNRSSGKCLVADETQTKIELGTCNADWALIPAITGTTESSVQQTVWIGSLTDENVSKLATTKVPDDLIALIRSLGLRSIQLMGDGSVVVAGYATYPTGSYRDDVAMAATQYIDYTLYNSILFTSNAYTF